MDDSRGIKRGKCNSCGGCTGFRPHPDGLTTCICGHPPGKHDMIGGTRRQDQKPVSVADALSHLSVSGDGGATAKFPQCSSPACSNDVYLDLNFGKEFKYCEHHRDLEQADDNSASDLDSSSESEEADISNGSITCAIEDCPKPRHVDSNGTVHECCGYTHAMELARRRILKKMKVTVVKGVTHCLLPECNKHTWPFMNYCGRSHAHLGKKRGLIPPVQPGLSKKKDSTHCELPECMKTKRVEGGRIFDFCGRAHAKEAERRGLNVPKGTGPKTSEMCLLDGCYKLKSKERDGTEYQYCSKAHADLAKSKASDPAFAKDDSMCIIPECTRPKYKDPKTGHEHDCCSKSHAEEARMRNIQVVLTSESDVQKFLANFPTLTIVNLKENDHAKPGGSLYKKFVTARNKLPENYRKTCLAFHGTAEANISSICANGYDPSRRSRQAYGVGEYFAASPGTPMGYCSGGKKLLLNELLLGQENVHHTKHGDIIVMKNPEHDLPRFVITFQ